MNPTVSESVVSGASWPTQSLRVVASRVENRRSCASTFAPVRPLRSVLLPALV